MPSPAQRTLVLGGARSGKSAFAESLLDARAPARYVATGRPPDGSDPEWAARVRAHRARRPPAWETVESVDLAGLLGEPGPPLLVDGLGLWLAAALDVPDVEGAVAALVAAWRACPVRAVLVSDEVGWGVVPASPAGRAFRDAIGTANQQLAAASDEVFLVVAGLVQRLK